MLKVTWTNLENVEKLKVLMLNFIQLKVVISDFKLNKETSQKCKIETAVLKFPLNTGKSFFPKVLFFLDLTVNRLISNQTSTEALFFH